MGGSDLTEPGAEGDLLGVADGLVAEEHDLPAQQGGTDLGDRGVVELLAQVDAVNLGSGVPGKRPDVDTQPLDGTCHRCVLQTGWRKEQPAAAAAGPGTEPRPAPPYSFLREQTGRPPEYRWNTSDAGNDGNSRRPALNHSEECRDTTAPTPTKQSEPPRRTMWKNSDGQHGRHTRSIRTGTMRTQATYIQKMHARTRRTRCRSCFDTHTAGRPGQCLPLE